MNNLVPNSMPQPIVIAVIVTDRSTSFRRLLDSLKPVAHDNHLHLVVMDNCYDESEREKLRTHVDAWHREAAGSAIIAPSLEPGAPLHETRHELTQLTMAFIKRLCPEPIIWVIDDDLTLERLVIAGETLRLENIAKEHLKTLRGWQRDQVADVVLGDFTGDPPIRPEAVLATQLSDLTFNLTAMANQHPNNEWRSPDVGADWQGDYFYDHAEHQQRHLAHRYSWRRRGDTPSHVSAQFMAMCHAAAHIDEGKTPFRPKITSKNITLNSPTKSPKRGGNAVFFNLQAFENHTYPAFSIENGWSRRSDMIGATILARYEGMNIRNSTLTLHHDRRGQSGLCPDPNRWKPEFLGVIISRLIMETSEMRDSDIGGQVRHIADERVRRICDTLDQARTHAREAIEALNEPSAWWWNEPSASLAAQTLSAQLDNIAQTLSAIHTDTLRHQLTSPSLLKAAIDAYKGLMSAHAARVEQRRRLA